MLLDYSHKEIVVDSVLFMLLWKFICLGNNNKKRVVFICEQEGAILYGRN